MRLRHPVQNLIWVLLTGQEVENVRQKIWFDGFKNWHPYRCHQPVQYSTVQSSTELHFGGIGDWRWGLVGRVGGYLSL